MEKEFIVELITYIDRYKGIKGQTVRTPDSIFDNNALCPRYDVYDLTECPEDATVIRSLFSGDEYIDALELGMKIARAGYTSIKVITKEICE